MSNKMNEKMENSNEDASKKPRYKTLMIDGTKYKTTYSQKFENRVRFEVASPKNMLAFIPGTVGKINVKEGQTVKKGTRLMILEAMKMKNRIDAPFNGTIKKIYVKEGETVPKNFVMIEFV
jgi:biotin carboxyl carrier protein